jgi:hypothetical protein
LAGRLSQEILNIPFSFLTLARTLPELFVAIGFKRKMEAERSECNAMNSYS